MRIWINIEFLRTCEISALKFFNVIKRTCMISWFLNALTPYYHLILFLCIVIFNSTSVPKAINETLEPFIEATQYT